MSEEGRGRLVSQEVDVPSDQEAERARDSDEMSRLLRLERRLTDLRDVLFALRQLAGPPPDGSIP